MAVSGYKFTALTGGTTGCLDALDGTDLGDGDLALVMTGDVLYHYQLSATSGAVEISPDIIAPDTNAGDKRWILQRVPAEEITVPDTSADYFMRGWIRMTRGPNDSTAADRRTIYIPQYIMLIDGILTTITAITLDLNIASSWDDSTYATAANRAGKDFYVYGLLNGTAILSANATIPAGYTGGGSRKIGGFHCQCLTNTGGIANLTGDILPYSIWDHKFRPWPADPMGMVYDPLSNIWVDIYLQSGGLSDPGNKPATSAANATTASVFGATITTNLEWYECVFDLSAVGKRLLSDSEFTTASNGSSSDQRLASAPTTTGGHTSVTGYRNISFIGCEDMLGVYWQYLSHNAYLNGSSTYTGTIKTNTSVHSFTGSHWIHQGTYSRMLAGGAWNASTANHCKPGSRNLSLDAYNIGVGRGCCAGINII